jgi:hypothetical protein
MNELYGDAIVERAAGIRTKEDFTTFLYLLMRNFREHPEEWENTSLEHYLQGLCGFAEGIEGYYANTGAGADMTTPGWRVFADMLLAARVYE